MEIFWPACFRRFSVWMVTLSTGSPPSDCGLWCCASPLVRGSPALRLGDPRDPQSILTGRLRCHWKLFPGGQGQVVVDTLPHLPDDRDQVVQVGGVVDEVDVA